MFRLRITFGVRASTSCNEILHGFNMVFASGDKKTTFSHIACKAKPKSDVDVSAGSKIFFGVSVCLIDRIPMSQIESP